MIRGSRIGLALFWVIGCAGTDGEPGVDGVDGPKGDTGAQGPTGVTGSSGPRGETGQTGPRGDAGAPAPVVDAGAPPTGAPAGVSFRDIDFQPTFVGGVVRLEPASDETDIDSYALYWGTGATQKALLQPFAVFPAHGAGEHRYRIAEGTLRPEGATHVLAYARNAAGEGAVPVAGVFADGELVALDLSAGQGSSSGTQPSAVLDPSTGQLLTVTQHGPSGNKPGLFRCDMDGANCTYVDVSAGQGGTSGASPSAIVAGDALIFATANFANGSKPSLFRCTKLGADCVHADVSSGQGASSALSPTLVHDAANARLLLVTQNGASSNRLALFRCTVDLATCSYVDISAGQGANSGQEPSAVIDQAGGKLLVVAKNGTNQNRLSLTRCELDGTGCTVRDLAAGQGTDSGSTPFALVDSVANKLLVVSRNGANQSKPLLTRCELDGSACVATDLSAGQGAGSGTTPKAVLDPATGRLLVATTNVAMGSRPSLFRCNPDGSSCRHTSLAAGRGDNSGLTPSLVLDPRSGAALIVTADAPPGNAKPALFTLR